MGKQDDEQAVEVEADAERVRKPYSAPRIEETGRFEHLVLTCSRTMGGGAECVMGMVRSIQ